jgi:hypothetical protein
MPNCGSWNNRWSGEGRLYARVRSITKDMQNKYNIKEKLDKGYYYNFGDGWGANISVEQIDSKAANKLRKNSKGFCGYDWMIDSILKNNKIIYEKSE